MTEDELNTIDRNLQACNHGNYNVYPAPLTQEIRRLQAVEDFITNECEKFKADMKYFQRENERLQRENEILRSDIVGITKMLNRAISPTE